MLRTGLLFYVVPWFLSIALIVFAASGTTNKIAHMAVYWAKDVIGQCAQ